MSDKTGGPAFPNTHATIPKEGDYWNYQGMTLRDYFAAKAMAVVMPSVVAELQKRSYSDEKTTQLKDAAAGACYGMADAMLKAREQ